MLGGTGLAAPSARAEQAALAESYPAAHWRLARRDELANVVLWVSHILVRHEGVTPGVVSFSLPDWTPEQARPARTREQAFEIAQRIADRLRDHPESFARVAREESEDLATRSLGGSLGGITALEWAHRYPRVLDALAALEVGEVSRVVESPHGFHVFLRRGPPPLETVSGARVVIGYDEAPWLAAFLARREIPKRTRAQALALAESVHARARAGEDFSTLVQAHSDHEDALRDGDFGDWSTRRPTPYPREIEVLQGLEIGEVAPPVDSPFGVQVIRRTENRPRQVYAMTAIERLYAGPVKGDELPAQTALLAEMTRLADDVQRDPARFTEMLEESCCSEVQQWPEGQGSAFAERALAPLRIGQVAPAAVQLHGAYALIRREAPVIQPEADIRFELPSPDRPDLAYLAGTGLLSARLHGAAEAASEALQLKAPLAGRFAKLHESARQSMEDAENADSRVRCFADLQESVRHLLGPRAYEEYAAYLDGYYSGLLLRQ